MLKALVIDGHAESLLEISEVVRAAGFSCDTASDLRTANDQLLKDLPDLVIIDLQIGETDDEEAAFRLFSRTGLGQIVEVWLVTDDPNYDSAARGMRIGASDSFARPVDLERLRRRAAALHAKLQRRERDRASRSNEESRLIGKSPAMKRVLSMIHKVAGTQASVLLYGESGTGKELIARSIHEHSQRHDAAFTAINCGAIARDLVESELFGHRKGAFTGAHKGHKGYFERARGGTLFLDEITEMGKDMQVKLLRVLETRHIRRVGGETDIPVDVRIIAATNQDPDDAVHQGKLREDLFYRLAEFPFRVPALRERGEDVRLLAERFLDELNRDDPLDKSFTEEAMQALRLHSWPGNVRELRNAVSRAFILANHQITTEDLPGNIPAAVPHDGDHVRMAVGLNLREVERRMIMATMSHFDGDKPRVAETLGISLKTLYNRLREYRGKT